MTEPLGHSWAYSRISYATAPEAAYDGRIPMSPVNTPDKMWTFVQSSKQALFVSNPGGGDAAWYTSDEPGIAMSVSEPSVDDLLLEAMAACAAGEKMLERFLSPQYRRMIAELSELHDEAQETVLAMRIQRLRLQARLSHDPDKTPVRPPTLDSLRRQRK